MEIDDFSKENNVEGIFETLVPEECNTTCDICKGKFFTKEGIVWMNEWLDVEMKCKKCNKIACATCLKVCYDCENEGEHNTMCESCNKKYKNFIEEIKCTIHTWFSCKKHREINKSSEFQCKECFANYNYSRKYSY